jgi:predicted transcriptional regulator YdeE
LKLHIARHTTISKPAATVYGIISDLNFWNTWSPWIHCEPTAKTHISGKQGAGQSQTWEGEVIGSGKMTIAELQDNNLVKMKLEFFKPWKSVADVSFQITETDPNHCNVTWSMDSSLPFFMIFFKKMMTAFMSSDFDRGLKMLREFAETGSVPSHSVYMGQKNQPGFQMIGKKNECKIRELSPSIQADLSTMNELAKNHEFAPPLKVAVLYHKFDIPNDKCAYIAGFYYGAQQSVKVPAGYNHLTYTEHTAIVVDHHGPYRFLGNPWAMSMSYLRGLKLKSLKSVPMYEVYITMPDGRAEKDIHTQIFVPVKS